MTKKKQFVIAVKAKDLTIQKIAEAWHKSGMGTEEPE